MPGLDGSGHLFAAFESCIAGDWKYRRLNYPADLPASMGAYVAHAERSIGDEQAVVLLAESFSGPVAIHLARRLGNRVKALVLCASFATRPHLLVAWASQWPEAWLAGAARMRWAIRGFCVGHRAPPPILGAVEAELSKLDGKTIKQRLRMLIAPEAANALAELDIPILLLQPANDRLLDPWAPKRLEELAPGAHIERLDGPHFLLQAEPHACWRRISDWLTLALPRTA